MATIKAYSVARTQKSYDPTTPTPPSTVYSYSKGRQGAYDHNDNPGLIEGRTPTLEVSGQTITGAAAATPFSAQTTAGTPRTDLASTSVVAETITLTGEGAGLQVRFTTTAGGAVPALANITAVQTGSDYSDGDTVEIEGWAGSVFVVDAA